MPRSELIATYEKVQNMVSHVQENLNADEYALFLDMVAPLPEPEQVEAKPKRGRKKAAKGASKRASGMAAALNRGLGQRESSSEPCRFQHEDSSVCGEVEGNPIHDPSMGYARYHEFRTAA